MELFYTPLGLRAQQTAIGLLTRAEEREAEEREREKE